MKPIVGIIEWPYWDKDNDKIYEVMNSLVESIIENGGQPIGIFPTNIDDFVEKKLDQINKVTKSELSDLKNILLMCDAIIKPGATKVYDHERLMYDIAVTYNIPYLGICAGMQMMSHQGKEKINNVKIESNINHRSKETYGHSIKILPNTLLRKIVGVEEILVNSQHSFRIPNPGQNIISAISEDGIIEAIENPMCDFCIGTQFHPENAKDSYNQSIFAGLIEAAKIYKKTK